MDEMWIQNSGIHTALVTIRRGKMTHYDVSLNDKSVFGRLDKLTWTARPGT